MLLFAMSTLNGARRFRPLRVLRPFHANHASGADSQRAECTDLHLLRTVKW